MNFAVAGCSSSSPIYIYIFSTTKAASDTSPFVGNLFAFHHSRSPAPTTNRRFSLFVPVLSLSVSLARSRPDENVLCFRLFCNMCLTMAFPRINYRGQQRKVLVFLLFSAFPLPAISFFQYSICFSRVEKCTRRYIYIFFLSLSRFRLGVG